MQLCAPCLQPRPYSFVLRACCCARLASRAHAGTAAPEGTTSACAPSRACWWNTCNIKHLLQHTFEIDEIFTTYACNICIWTLQHMQHPDKTLATYVWNRWNIWNIHL
jgi:hypothetical protein